MTTKKVAARGVASAPDGRVTQPRTSRQGSRGFAHRTTGKTPRASYSGTFRALAAILMLTAFGCWIAAVVELPEHVTHAVLWIVAGAASWLVGEAMTR